ncbi:MAG: hypothetical protein KC619_33575 [Myxococcales bacterium]|nr:hypothetical protein [Myxococcales bacterium]
MAYRDEDTALAARGAALRVELRERESLELALELVRVEHRRRERRLRTFDHLPIASPCDASWEAMEGDGPMRRCHRCEEDVYDLAGLSPDAALALVEHERGSKRLHRRADGTVITGDCPEGRRRYDRRGLALAGGVLLSAAAFAVAAAPSVDDPYTAPPPVPEHVSTLLLCGPFDSAPTDTDPTFDEATFQHGWQEDPGSDY